MSKSLTTKGIRLLLLGALSVTALPVMAGDGSPSGIAQREIIRRQQRIADAQEAAARGDAYAAEGAWEQAINEYRTALDTLPYADNTDAIRAAIEARYADASVELARQRAGNGEYDSARGLLNSVLAMNPDHQKAQTLLKHLDDPDRYPVALTPEHMKNVREVERLLRLGVGYSDLGQYDKAREQFNAVLGIDRYNSAARGLLEKTDRTIMSHLRTSRDQMRSQMIRQVDELWQVPVPNVSLLPNGSGDSLGGEADGSQLIIEKLRRIVIPSIQFDQATVDEAITFLRIKSRQLDDLEPDPERKGINFILKTQADTAANVTLSLTNVPLIVALKAITDLAGLRHRVEPFAVVIVPITDEGSELYTRVFQVRPDFLSLGGSGAAEAVSDDPFADNSAPSSGLNTKSSASEILTAAGVTFTEGASAFFNPVTSQLIVRNTANALDIVQTFIEQNQNDVQKQVFITSKFVEVSQRNTDELGFDWLLGQANAGSSERVFFGGGTTGNRDAGPLSSSNWVFTPPTSSTNPVPLGSNPLTSGLRSGSNAISSDAVDGLIARQSTADGGSTGSVAPAIFGLGGVFTDPQFQVVVRALNQNKGTDLMSAPSIVTRSGQRAKIEIIREFIYPTEFDPPEIPQEFGSIDTGGGGGFGLAAGGSQASTNSFPVTPTTPTAFETRNVGVTLEVDPVVGSDGFTIDLNIAPEVVEFEGFVNYGSPITTGGTDANGNPTQVVLTENKIEQPIFASRKVSTAVTIWDGQTVAIGGLIREDVQTVDDKVPFLGDLPVLGRLFRSKSEEHFKRNLIIFVTAELIDPSGERLRNTRGGSTLPMPVVDSTMLDGGAGPDAGLLGN
ncbi:MAG: general secretion pathway protein D [Verrucomicrobiales bacterium]|jgi:general secretion pathway protein D